jgi:DNA polymerase
MMMIKECKSTGSAADFLPATLSLPQLRAASKTCRGCDLYCDATQTVFGEGPKRAPIMLIGEQPGDQEDQQGHPFVGPSGRLLDELLKMAGISREKVYLTNAVKHFKWERRGKRRLHSKPSAREIDACRPWLEAEIAVIKPKVIVCLGATAAQSLLGAAFRLTKHRGEFQKTPFAQSLLATVHPSALLRMPDPGDRAAARQQFIEDLRLAFHHSKSGRSVVE